jgi:transcriptional regulator with XRE-family HTH domain
MPPRTQAKDPDNDPAALLGDELRELRVAAGYRSQDEVAAILQADRSVLGRIETGDRAPNADTLGVLLTTYGVSGRLRRVYERLGRVARARSGEGPVRIWFAGYLKAELEAHVLRFWAPVIMPGLLQTEGYATALFTAMGMGSTQVREQVETRLKRQDILARLVPPSVIVVLWEPVLHHLIGKPEIMREQLARLLDLSQSIVIQVVPSRLGGNAGLGGMIALATRPGAHDVLLAGSMVEDVVTQHEDQVRRASVTFEQVRADALPRQESRAVIQEALEKWNSE